MENFELVINELEDRAKSSDDLKLKKWLTNSANLLRELDDRGIQPSNFAEEIKVLRRQLDADTKANMIRSFYGMMTDSVRKQFGLTTPGYYQTLWMSLGMLVFGIPMGLVFSGALGNYAFLGIGIPIGLSIGIAVGAGKDKKAKEAGKQILHQ